MAIFIEGRGRIEDWMPRDKEYIESEIRRRHASPCDRDSLRDPPSPLPPDIFTIVITSAVLVLVAIEIIRHI